MREVRRGRRALGRVVLGVTTVAPPLGLVAWAPAPWALGGSGIEAILERPDDVELHRIVPVLLAGALWVQWARFIVILVVEYRTTRVTLPSSSPSSRRDGALRSLAAGLLALAGIVVPRGGGAAGLGASPPALVVHNSGVDMGWTDTGVVAAGVVTFIGTARRHRLRRAPRGTRVPVPPADDQTTERALRTAATGPWFELHHRWSLAWTSTEDEDTWRPMAAVVGDDGEIRIVRGRTSTTASDSRVPALVAIGRSRDGVVHIPQCEARRLEIAGPVDDVLSIRRALRIGDLIAGPLVSDGDRQVSGMDAEPWRLVANVDTWRLEPPALDVSPFGLTSVEDRGVRSMIERARSPWPSTIATVGESDTSEPTDPSNTWSYMVRVLGNVDVVDRQGNRVPIERGKSLELLTWLALHRRHPSREAARTALWDSDVRDSTFANVVSEARRALHRHAARPDGDEWLRRGNSERIEVHDGVVTDEEIFRRHVSRARREGGEVAIDEWRRALELVRGAPFVGSGYGWADAEVLTSNLTLMIVDTAVDLAEAELEAGRIAGAFRATGLGLMVLPGHEQLVAIRLRSHARAGDHAGLRHEWRTYERSLLDDPWQSEPSPWLAELVEELIAESVVR